jgi:hypothetical protein
VVVDIQVPRLLQQEQLGVLAGVVAEIMSQVLPQGEQELLVKGVMVELALLAQHHHMLMVLAVEVVQVL